jgi:hypothetical protein
MNPIFPVVIDYGEGDVELFKSFDIFIESSGCEEEDFDKDNPIIVDSRHRCFRFSYKKKQFMLLGVEPSASAIQLLG